MISTSNIFYGACALLTIGTCVGMYALLDSKKIDPEYLSFLAYQDDDPDYDTIRVYNPFDKKILYREEAEQSYTLLRNQLKKYEDDSDDGYSVDFGPCIEKNEKTGSQPMWGVPERKPCVFLKLKNPKPKGGIQYYTNATTLPDDMPQELKAHIRENPVKNMIWMSCDGEFDHNRKNLGGKGGNETISYHPHRGFDGSLFECANNGKTCEDPIVAIKFESILTHIGVYIVCDIWSPNFDDKIRFQIYVD